MGIGIGVSLDKADPLCPPPRARPPIGVSADEAAEAAHLLRAPAVTAWKGSGDIFADGSRPE